MIKDRSNEKRGGFEWTNLMQECDEFNAYEIADLEQQTWWYKIYYQVCQGEELQKDGW